MRFKSFEPSAGHELGSYSVQIIINIETIAIIVTIAIECLNHTLLQKEPNFTSQVWVHIPEGHNHSISQLVQGVGTILMLVTLNGSEKNEITDIFKNQLNLQVDSPYIV